MMLKLYKNSCYTLKYLSKLDIKIISLRTYTSRNILKLYERGFWKDRYPESDLKFEKELVSHPQTVYCGFDPTADSLHIGNLLILIGLLHFQRAGHYTIALIGGATGAIGDPSGKLTERLLLQSDIVQYNSKAISSLIKNIFSNHEKYLWSSINNNPNDMLKPIRIVDNFSWYNNLNILDYLRYVGKHMAMGSLLRRSTIKKRLEEEDSLSYAEFSYQVLQAYDWLHLYQKYNCTIQIGGSDQLGNIATGYKLIKRIEDVQVTGLTVPLITSKEGDKLGKTAGNAIWLSPEKTSEFDFYQYFVRVKDDEIEYLLNLFSFLSRSEIETLMNLQKNKPEERIPQKKLAEKLTILVHGEDGLKRALKCTEVLYGGNSEPLSDLKKEDIINMFKGSSLTTLVLNPGMTVLEMAMKANCFAIDWRGVQIIEAGGFLINQAKVTNPHLVVLPGVHILPSNVTLLRVGKKNYHIVEWK